MTITFDPHHPKYVDEKDVRDEMTRVFDVCEGCRQCVSLCPTFPSLFAVIDALGDHGARDAGRLTPSQQDEIVDECFHCTRCSINCPYVPGRHELALDFPRLMLRTQAMRHATQQLSPRNRLTTFAVAHTDLVGRLATAMPVVANRAIGAKPGGFVRTVIATTAGVSSQRLLPPFARTRFSTWNKARRRLSIDTCQASVALFATCLVEYQAPQIGKDLIRVYERNDVECSLAEDATCCGAPYLHSGDVDAFTNMAAKNVALLADIVRSGKDIVVPQPTCGHVLKKDYVDYVGGSDAELVARHTFDSSEYLMTLNDAGGTQLDTHFEGHVPATITYHEPCHLRALDIGVKSRDLMKLTGAAVTLVRQCAGVGAMWGLRAENEERSIPVAGRLAGEVDGAGGEIVAGDCHLANMAITEQTSRIPMHPMSVIARAYGIPEE